MTTPTPAFRCTFLLTSDLHSALESEKDKKILNPIVTTDGYPSLKEQVRIKKLTIDSEIGGAVRRINYINEMRKLNRLLFLDAGDFLSGSLWFKAFEGSLDVEVLNIMKCDALAIGNHDFDLGWDHLKELLKKVNFAVLCSNIFEINDENGKRKKEPICDPYKIFEVGNGRKVAVIGIMGQSSWDAIALPKKSRLKFRIPDKVLPELLKTLPQVDYSILLSHSGIETDRDYAKKYPQINAILGGHSHTLMDQCEKIGQSIVLHAGARGRVISKLEVDGDQIRSNVEILDVSWDLMDRSQEAEKIDGLLKENKSKVAEGYKQEVAICLEPISAHDKKTKNSDLGKLISEMLCTIEPKADLAFIYSGSILPAQLEKGPLTLGDLSSLVHGGDDPVWTVTANGAWIEKIMAAAESRWGGPSKQIQYGGIVESSEKEFRIKDKPLEKERLYSIRAPSFFFGREEKPESIIKNEYLVHSETLTELIITAFSEQKEIKKL
jgi:5'-nucleotidase / UDP-sugar diphosphatase